MVAKAIVVRIRGSQVQVLLGPPNQSYIIMQLVIEIALLAIAVYMLVSAFFFEPEDKQKDDKRTEN